MVFTTAYDSHAIEAFEAGAVDYLLKPVQADRLAQTVARLRWISASVGDTIKLFGINDVLF